MVSGLQVKNVQFQKISIPPPWKGFLTRTPPPPPTTLEIQIKLHTSLNFLVRTPHPLGNSNSFRREHVYVLNLHNVTDDSKLRDKLSYLLYKWVYFMHGTYCTCYHPCYNMQSFKQMLKEYNLMLVEQTF